MKMQALLAALLCSTVMAASAGQAICPGTVPAQGAAVRGATPVFPADNWWNLDIRNAPIDADSAAFIAFINNGGTRRLHPDFGGEASPGSVAIYGMPNSEPERDWSAVFEAQTFAHDGVKTLISRNHYDRERFFQIYDEPRYAAAKARLDPQALFHRGVFDKLHRAE